MRATLIRRMLVSNFLRSDSQQVAAPAAAAAAQTTDRLRKIDLTKDWSSLPQAQQMYITKMIAKNNERWGREKKLRTHYRICAGVLFSVVFSIYFYSMYAVKQEKFLDDFETPTPPDAKNLKQ